MKKVEGFKKKAIVVAIVAHPAPPAQAVKRSIETTEVALPIHGEVLAPSEVEAIPIATIIPNNSPDATSS